MLGMREHRHRRTRRDQPADRRAERTAARPETAAAARPGSRVRKPGEPQRRTRGTRSPSPRRSSRPRRTTVATMFGRELRRRLRRRPCVRLELDEQGVDLVGREHRLRVGHDGHPRLGRAAGSTSARREPLTARRHERRSAAPREVAEQVEEREESRARGRSAARARRLWLIERSLGVDDVRGLSLAVVRPRFCRRARDDERPDATCRCRLTPSSGVCELPVPKSGSSSPVGIVVVVVVLVVVVVVGRQPRGPGTARNRAASLPGPGPARTRAGT